MDDTMTRLAEKMCRVYETYIQQSREQVVVLMGSVLREAMEDLKADKDRWADSAVRLEQAQEKIRAEAYTRCAEVAREAKKEYAQYHQYDYEAGAWETAEAIAAAIEKLAKE